MAACAAVGVVNHVVRTRYRCPLGIEGDVTRNGDGVSRLVEHAATVSRRVPADERVTGAADARIFGCEHMIYRTRFNILIHMAACAAVRVICDAVQDQGNRTDIIDVVVIERMDVPAGDDNAGCSVADVGKVSGVIRRSIGDRCMVFVKDDGGGGCDVAVSGKACGVSIVIVRGKNAASVSIRRVVANDEARAEHL